MAIFGLMSGKKKSKKAMSRKIANSKRKQRKKSNTCEFC